MNTAPRTAALLLALACGTPFAQTAAEKAAGTAQKAAAAAEAAASSAEASASAAARSAQDLKAAYPSDNDRFDGDKLTLRTRLGGFVEVGNGTPGTGRCAPSGSELKVIREDANDLVVRFTRVGKGQGECGSAQGAVVEEFVAYRIEKRRLAADADFRRTGVSFGALIVPFKFRTGDKEIVSSATVAPYLGWRTGWFSSYGVSFTPLFSAGLGLVPVNDPASGRTETRAAFSAATGIVMGSTKNEAFQAGFLVGRDFLGRTDAALDPGSKKVWLSFYVGYTLSQN